MKWILFVLLIFFVGNVYAVDVCESRGYNRTVSYNEYNGFWVFDHNIEIAGTARKIYYNSTEFIDAIVYKSGSRTYTLAGNFSGTVPKTTLSNDFVYVAFCSNTPLSSTIPEFGVIGAVVTIVCCLWIYRKI